MPGMTQASSIIRRAAQACLATLALLALGATAQAQTEAWPQRPVRILLPFAAGGNIDVMGRLMAQRLSEKLGQQFIVENRVGGNGMIATEAVARSAPDGYTLLWASTSVIAIVPAITKTPYDPVKDLTPIAAATAGPQVLLVNSKVPAKNMQEFIAWVKAQKEKVAYGGGGGAGSASNLIMSMIQMRAGVTMTSVGYRGTAPALTDVMAGHIPTMVIPVSEAVAQESNPNIRILAVTSETRSRRIPNVPTIAESGYPGFNAVSWTGMMGPAGMPKEIVDKIAAEMVAACKDPQFIEQLVTAGNDPLGYGPAEFTALIAKEIPIWAAAAKAAGLTMQ